MPTNKFIKYLSPPSKYWQLRLERQIVHISDTAFSLISAVVTHGAQN